MSQETSDPGSDEPKITDADIAALFDSDAGAAMLARLEFEESEFADQLVDPAYEAVQAEIVGRVGSSLVEYGILDDASRVEAFNGTNGFELAIAAQQEGRIDEAELLMDLEFVVPALTENAVSKHQASREDMINAVAKTLRVSPGRDAAWLRAVDRMMGDDDNLFDDRALSDESISATLDMLYRLGDINESQEELSNRIREKVTEFGRVRLDGQYGMHDLNGNIARSMYMASLLISVREPGVDPDPVASLEMLMENSHLTKRDADLLRDRLAVVLPEGDDEAREYMAESILLMQSLASQLRSD